MVVFNCLSVYPPSAINDDQRQKNDAIQKCEAELRASLSRSNIAIAQSELHHCSANNVALSEQINVLVDFIKFEKLDAVTNLVFGGKRHDLTQVRVVAPIRTMKGLFAGHARK